MKKPRMTDLDIRMIVEELEAWGKKERGKKLSWAILERIFPFTRQTMYSKPEIREANEKASMTLKAGKFTAKAKSVSDSNDLVIQRLKNQIKELELQVEEFQKLWIELKVE